MKKSIVSDIILKTHKPSMLVAAVLGCLIGFLLVIASLQIYFDFRYILSDKDQMIGSQYLVLNKKVSVFNAMDKGKSAFSEKQISELRTQPSVERISTFLPNKFEAEAYLQLKVGSESAELKTDLFLESVEDAFIDVQTNDWSWKEGSTDVPVILPTDFINLYNFTYAPARGLPQISKNTAELFNFKIILGEGFSKTTYIGKIAGFSNRITSMIVPISFMRYANEKFASPENRDQNYYRLIVEVKPEKLNQFQQYIRSKGYETNEELLKSGKFSSLLHAILSIVFILGIIMIINAFFGFLLYLQLVITRSKYELETLLRIGYPHYKLVRWYANGVGMMLMLIGGLAFAGLYYIQHKMAVFVSEYGFEFPAGLNGWVLMSGLLIVSLLYIIFSLSLRKQIYQLSLPEKRS